MKKNLSKFFVFGIFLSVVLGCSLFNKIQKEVEKTQTPKTLTASDESCQIVVPGNWQTRSDLNDDAVIQAGNLPAELYIVVIRESKEDYGKKADLDFYTNLIRDNFKKTVTDPVLSEPLSVNINGHAAKQFETGGEMDNIKVKYIYTTVETPKNYYQIVSWTLSSRFDANRSKLAEVINSFKEVDAQQSDSQHSNTVNKKGV